MSDASDLLKVLAGIQKRACVSASLPSKVSTLYEQLLETLNVAYREELLSTGPYDISRLLKMTNESNYRVIAGGEKVFKQRANGAQFTRDDGAWFHFAVSIAENADGLILIAYDFEIVFPEDEHLTFVRFDLNKLDHANDSACIRSHLHLNTDDDGLSIPTLLMSPLEILMILIYKIRRTNRKRIKRKHKVS